MAKDNKDLDAFIREAKKYKPNSDVQKEHRRIEHMQAVADAKKKASEPVRRKPSPGKRTVSVPIFDKRKPGPDVSQVTEGASKRLKGVLWKSQGDTTTEGTKLTREAGRQGVKKFNQTPIDTGPKIQTGDDEIKRFNPHEYDMFPRPEEDEE